MIALFLKEIALIIPKSSQRAVDPTATSLTLQMCDLENLASKTCLASELLLRQTAFYFGVYWLNLFYL
ncbi:hypothetical protein [Acanthopleuribacter pedis]|uniref:Uncharacterized protein n=1 Tax=Acanthopleuribacter pedis TaxID=442870 RepID=A0A8J7QJS9_9BACT|nr:hypothetical protein [Acanthopleuribacter pedis]MBO1322196.1 hypothetical protein [Acanthopleuribacter pedis]